MQISDIDYERRYALAEIDLIINHMDEECKKKIPAKILQTIKNEKKYGYKPNFDFSKPLVPQVTRQETKDMMAYLYIHYICDNEKDMQDVLMHMSINASKAKENNMKKRKEEIKRKAKEQPQSLDSALKNRLK